MTMLTERGDVVLPLTLPVAQYRKVAHVATKRGINAHTLIEDMIARAVKNVAPVIPDQGPKRSPNSLAASYDEIRRMWLDKKTDEEIAKALGFKPASIQTYRSRVGLVENRRGVA